MIRSRLLVRALAAALALAILAPAVPTYAASPQPPAAAGPVISPKSGAFLGSVTITEAQLEAAGMVKPTDTTGSGPRVALAVTPQAGCLYNCIHVRDVRFWYEGQLYETQAQANNRTGYPGTLSLDVTLSVSNSWSATVGISVSIVSAAVGFGANSSASVHFGYAQTVPPYTCLKVLAYELVKVWKFNVYQEPFIGSDQLIGSGWAWNRDGQRFDVYYC